MMAVAAAVANTTLAGCDNGPAGEWLHSERANFGPHHMGLALHAL